MDEEEVQKGLLLIKSIRTLGFKDLKDLRDNHGSEEIAKEAGKYLQYKYDKIEETYDNLDDARNEREFEQMVDILAFLIEEDFRKGLKINLPGVDKVLPVNFSSFKTAMMEGIQLPFKKVVEKKPVF